MIVSLAPSEMYGHWTHCEPKICEFQCGETMIYVSYTNEDPMERRLAIAQNTINLALGEMEDALAFAAQISAKNNPAFWANVRRISLRQRPLVVFSVRYPMDSDLPIYEISWNPIFESESGVGLSDDWMEEIVQIDELPNNGEVIFLKRLGAQEYEQVPNTTLQ